ncbi:uncharacterized protein LOC123539308 [Mercenaria mercenaria]|uniref:uncharacterized protein LOC123539308 n=1 Tax=Mercenaria mercenaria TaxID=6596 RepID=UPI001E1DAECC|nr:uncharacterized protein LOC123539308 [Mercenaria mercenaria]
MAVAKREHATSGANEDDCHVTITEDLTSSAGDSVINKHSGDDTGHEKLLRKTASVDGKAIPHCRASRPPHYLYFALIVTLCCNFPFGGVAVIFSLLSKRSGKKGNIKDAEFWGTISKWFSIVGIAIALVVVAFLIVYYVHIDKNIVDTPEELHLNEG